MPRVFFGMIRDGAGRCGLCQRVVTVSTDRKKAGRELRRSGWTWREDTGWVCSCRHAYGNLPPGKDPLERKRRLRRIRANPQGDRRYPKPSTRIRAMIRRRNRQGIE